MAKENDKKQYALIDVETTGGKPVKDKITEIAIVVFDGEKIIEEFQTLINPERNIPYYITKLTGINNHMVESAPKFYEVAKKIHELTDSRVFVAHNARFDYSFVKKEFDELGFNFQREILCTVKKARQLLPGYKSYSLGKITKQLGIEMTGHHRAMNDVRGMLELFKILLKTKEGEVFEKETEHKALLPPLLKYEDIDTLPTSPGVYYFLNEKKRIIYIGKSKNIRSRVLTHLRSDYKSRKLINFKDQIAKIEYEATGSELMALVRESHEIKVHRPRFNVALKKVKTPYILCAIEQKSGHLQLKVLNQPKGIEVMKFNGRTMAKRYMNKLIEKYQLDPSRCFIGTTAMASINNSKNEAPADFYNLKVQSLIKDHQYRYPNCVIIDKGRTRFEKSVFWIEENHLTHCGFINEEHEITSPTDIKQYLDFIDENRDARSLLIKKSHLASSENIIKLDGATAEQQHLDY